MCGRYVLVVPNLDELRMYLPIDDVIVQGWVPRYNIAPSQLAPVLRIADNGRSRIELLQWGLLRGDARDSLVQRPINARMESLHQRAAFRRSFNRQHCIVPATGYYEWQAFEGGKQPWLITPPTGLLAMAGLWDRWIARDGEVVETFAIVTTDAPPQVAHIHARAPLLLEAHQTTAWLKGQLKLPWVSTVSSTLRANTVSTRVNAAGNDDPSLVESVAPVVREQLTLGLDAPGERTR